MEFTIDRQTFLQGLYKTQGIIEKKSTINVLSHVLISSVPEGVQLTSTDYDVIFIGTWPAEIHEPGAIAVNGRNLFEVVKSLPDLPVRIRSQSNHWIELHCGRSRFSLAGISPEEFPRLQEEADLPSIRVPKATIQSMIDKTVFSVSNDETRMNLNGVFFQVQPREGDQVRLVMVSTDGHRLSKVEEIVEGVEGEIVASEAIVHKKGIFELKRLFEGPESHTNVGFVNANTVFKNDGATMFIRRIEESFPDYNKVIPAESSISVAIPRVAFMDAIRRIATLTTNKASIIRLELRDDKLTLLSQNPEAGEGRDEIDVAYNGTPLVIGFNFRYLLDVLSVIGGDEVRFEINDQFSPGVIRSDEDPDATFVIMPMRIG